MTNINIEIEKTLDLLNDIERIPSDPMFYNDLRNRIESLNRIQNEDKSILNSKNLLFALLILVNLFTVIYFYSLSKNSIKEEKLITTAQIYHIDHSNSDLITFNK
jgi:hypothetical protein